MLSKKKNHTKKNFEIPIMLLGELKLNLILTLISKTLKLTLVYFFLISLKIKTLVFVLIRVHPQQRRYFFAKAYLLSGSN